MAVLHEVNLQSVVGSQNLDIIRVFLNKVFWDWYDANTDRAVTTLRIWFIRRTVHVRDLYSVFELLFGPHP